MTWREQLVARMVADDPALAADIKHLSNHIGIHAPKVPEDS